MSVVCDACSTRNRDGAMFCLGCARRLPAFVPGPVVEAWPPVVAQPGRGVLALLPGEKPAFWIALGLLVLAMGAAFIGWYFPVTRDFRLPEIEAVFRIGQQAEAPRVATAPPETEKTEAARPVPPAPPEPAPPEPIAQETKLAPVETIPVTPTPPVQQVKAGAAQKEASDAPPSRPSRSTQAAGAGDPMRACANLDYLSMNRCASEQCDKPQFREHPRCETVRAQRWQRQQAQPNFAQRY